jgi:hypothetical protein
LSLHPESSERCAPALAELLRCQGRPQGIRDGALLGGVRLKACEVVERNDTFNDKQSQVAKQKTGDQQRPGERSKNSA